MQRFFCLIILLFSSKVLATAQRPDYLILGKDTLKIHSNPLESYFKEKPFPQNLITTRSSGNWRGYIAYFKFVDNNLVVENIYKQDYRINSKGKYEDFITSIYKEIFGEKAYFPCNYYNGLLVCPYGEMLEYVHMGYGSTYEFYRLFEIKSGKLIKSKDMSGNEYYNFRVAYFKYYKTTEVYKIEREKFIQMTKEVDEIMEEDIEVTQVKKSKKEKNLPKENPYLKQKEEEYQQNKMVDSFLFEFMNDYIETLEIPKNN